MAIIKESEKLEDSKSETTEAETQNAGTFEEVEKIKARLFHPRDEAFRLWGIRKNLLILGGLLAASLVFAGLPLIVTVEDAHALVVSSELIHVEASKEGTLTDVLAREGERVQKNALLARIINPDDENQISAAQASLRIAEARLQALDSKRLYLFDRYGEDQKLFEEKAISREEFLNTELSFKTLEHERVVLQAELNASKEKLRSLEEEKSRGDVRAPIQGEVISDLGEKLGAYVTKGEFLLTFASTGKRLQFFLPEEDFGRVAPGDPAEIKFYFLPNKTFRGRVAGLKHYAEPQEKSGRKNNFIKVLIELEHFPEGIRNGMTARVKIHGRPVSLLNVMLRRI